MPLNTDGTFTPLTLTTATAQAIALFEAQGITVQAGSPEEQLVAILANLLLQRDNADLLSYTSEYSPIGTQIDQQNPNFPRRDAKPSTGYLSIFNNTGANIPISIGTNFVASNGLIFESTMLVNIPDGETVDVTIQSVETGTNQNLPPGQTFTGPGGVITNPAPIANGADLESDADYLDRITYSKTNVTSIQSSISAQLELLANYPDAVVYVNENVDATLTPVPVPPEGVNVVVKFPSGVAASSIEQSAAIGIISRRFEFGNLNSQNTALHPIFSGSYFTGVFAQYYSMTIAQAVNPYITIELSVSFPVTLSAIEKEQLAENFASDCVQRFLNVLGGAGGNFLFTFNPASGSPIGATPAVVAPQPLQNQIAPFISAEALRNLVADADTTSGSMSGIRLISTDVLTVEFDPAVEYESPVTLSINPVSPEVSTIDFKKDALFSDETSWYDRYTFLDPANVMVTITEVV